MAEASGNESASPEPLLALKERGRRIMAHAWMVRTFIKHCDEIDDHPDLMGIVRAVFDMSRALPTAGEDPVAWFGIVRKKIGKLRTATKEFRSQAWAASTHTNFEQAVISMEAALEDLEALLKEATPLLPQAGPPPAIQLPAKTPQRPATDDSSASAAD